MVISFLDCTEKYHKEINRIVDFLSEYFNSLKIKNYQLKVAQKRIVKCTKCRCCTQKNGIDPEKCFIADEMNEVIDQIEEADAYVILADRNSLFSENKVYKKFSERLVSYYYWPYGKVKAVPRKVSLDKTSILINYNTTKLFMNHSFITSITYMKKTSSSIGAEVLDWELITPKDDLIKSYKTRLLQMANKLIASLKKEAS